MFASIRFCFRVMWTCWCTRCVNRRKENDCALRTTISISRTHSHTFALMYHQLYLLNKVDHNMKWFLSSSFFFLFFSSPLTTYWALKPKLHHFIAIFILLSNWKYVFSILLLRLFACHFHYALTLWRKERKIIDMFINYIILCCDFQLKTNVFDLNRRYKTCHFIAIDNIRNCRFFTAHSTVSNGM